MRRDHRVTVGEYRRLGGAAAFDSGIRGSVDRPVGGRRGPTTLRVSRISDFLPSIHPVELGTGNQELMADIVFSTLVDVDKDEVTILPDLAQTWDVTPDATTYTFHLNPAAVWSDGQPVTADDVLWTIAWSAQNPDAFKQIPVSAYLEVKGAADVKGTTKTPVGAEKIDDHTVKLTLAAPDSTFLRRLAGAVYYILPKHKLDGLTAAQAETCPFCLGTVGKTIGSGPYDFSESISAGGATFKAKKNYWKGKDSQIDTLVYKIQESNVSVAQLAAGELDLTIRVPPAEGPGLANVPGLKQLNVPGVGIFNINFNNTNTDKAAAPGDRLRDQPAGGDRQGPRWPGDPQLHDPARVQGLRRHQQVRVQPGQGQGAPGHLEVGQEQDLPAGAAGRGSELHGHRSGAPAVHRGPGHQGRADRAADRAVHGPDPEDQ